MIVTRCPICEKSMRSASSAELPYLPFCSERCKRIDLGRWLGESYRIPGAQDDKLIFNDSDEAED